MEIFKSVLGECIFLTKKKTVKQISESCDNRQVPHLRMTWHDTTFIPGVCLSVTSAYDGAPNHCRDPKAQDQPICGPGRTSDCPCSAVHTRYPLSDENLTLSNCCKYYPNYVWTWRQWADCMQTAKSESVCLWMRHLINKKAHTEILFVATHTFLGRLVLSLDINYLSSSYL